METLKNKQAILNLIGQNTVLSFEVACDGILTYNTVMPKYIKGVYYNFTVEVFYTNLNIFLKYESLKDVLLKKPFRVTVINTEDEGVVELFLRKFDESVD